MCHYITNYENQSCFMFHWAELIKCPTNYDISMTFYIEDIFKIMDDQVMAFAKTVNPQNVNKKAKNHRNFSIISYKNSYWNMIDEKNGFEMS